MLLTGWFIVILRHTPRTILHVLRTADMGKHRQLVIVASVYVHSTAWVWLSSLTCVPVTLGVVRLRCRCWISRGSSRLAVTYLYAREVRGEECAHCIIFGDGGAGP